MDLLVLGCQAGMPSGGRASSGYLLTAGAGRILLDCGPGVAAALSTNGGVERVDAIVITHLHPDHCYDLLPIGTTRLRVTTGRRLPLYAPAGAEAMLARLADVFPLGPEVDTLPRFFDAYSIREYAPGDVYEIAGATVHLVGLRHVVAGCGVRISDGTRVLAYTGDTGLDPNLRVLADGADLLLSEATLAETDLTGYGHLSAADAAAVAANAGVGRLVLTHLTRTDSEWEDARRLDAEHVFAGPVHIAHPGDQFSVG
jgi:ribonuclease BN (tRNA processing enzyme)